MYQENTGNFRFFITVSIAVHTLIVAALYFSLKPQTYITFEAEQIEIKSFKKTAQTRSPRKEKTKSHQATDRKTPKKPPKRSFKSQKDPSPQEITESIQTKHRNKFSPNIEKRQHNAKDDIIQNDSPDPSKTFTPQELRPEDTSENLNPGRRRFSENTSEEKTTAEPAAASQPSTAGGNLNWQGSRKRAVVKEPPPINLPPGLRGKTGIVKITIEVDAAGRVFSAYVSAPSYSPALDTLARENAQKYRFEPVNQGTDKGEVTYIFRSSQ